MNNVTVSFNWKPYFKIWEKFKTNLIFNFFNLAFIL